jgi:superfamily II DNA/RNA helicase
VRVLVSTDAGGEGLNLQFCHVVINYDMPWNPMRLEQRIGRVDRIGQPKTVRAINFVFEDSVEFRVREVLAFASRRKAIARVGLPEVRHYRQNQCNEEEADWRKELEAAKQIVPEMRPLLLMQIVEGGAGG